MSIVYRYADGRYERLPSLARSLVAQGVAVLVATASGAAVYAARDATRTIPIIFTLGNDPVAMGLVPSLGRPGGNLTGAMLFAQSLMSKRLELLRELLPQARLFAVLVNPDSRALDVYIGESERAAHLLGVGLRVLRARNLDEIAAAFARARSQRIAGVLVSPEPLFDVHRKGIVEAASIHAIPAIFGYREYSAAGGLLSYGPSLTWGYRQAGEYVARVLNGTNPGDLPVVQPTRFELVLNLRTANALGITVPLPLRLRADEVIE